MSGWSCNSPASRCTMQTSVSGRDLFPQLVLLQSAFSARRGRQRPCLPCTATLVGPGTRRTSPSPGENNRPELITPLMQPLIGKETEERATRASVATHLRYPNGLPLKGTYNRDALDEAYARCGIITEDYAKTFYLALDSWEHRLESLFEGRPYDAMDAALTDTVAHYPVSIQPFKDMIDGMRMDLTKARYCSFDELYDYCYKVAGTVGLMTTPVMGVDPTYKGPLEAVYRAALALGTANQLTNILRDVGEDAAQRNRIYVPLDELDQFGIRESEIISGNMFSPHTGLIDDRWERFMKFQISRARAYFADAEAGVDFLDSDARWPVWSALILYRQILDAIEANGYNNFTQRAYVKKWRKYGSLPLAFLRARMPIGLLQEAEEVTLPRRKTVPPRTTGP